jgi:ABC-type uncharacterized transport system auxiliary subunit
MTTTSLHPIPPSAPKRFYASRKLFGLFILALLLGGCASRAHWKKETFALTAPSAGPGPAAHTNILSLRRVTVSPLFEGRPLVYRTGEHTYETDSYAEFLVPPARMLEECLRARLRNGHAFAGVLDLGGNLKPDCSLDVSVSLLYGDFQRPDRPLAVLQMRFLLYSADPRDRGRVLWAREFLKSVPFTRRTPAALVAAWDTALQQIMDEVNADLKQLIIPSPPPEQIPGPQETAW